MAPSLPPISSKAVPLQIDPFDDWETVNSNFYFVFSILFLVLNANDFLFKFLQAYSRDEPILEKSSNAKLWSEALVESIRYFVFFIYFFFFWIKTN